MHPVALQTLLNCNLWAGWPMLEVLVQQHLESYKCLPSGIALSVNIEDLTLR